MFQHELTVGAGSSLETWHLEYSKVYLSILTLIQWGGAYYVSEVLRI